MATLEPQSTTLPPLPLSTTTQNAILIPNYNNNNSNNNQQQIPFESLSNYEQTREQRIKENRERLQKLGIVDLTLQLNSLVSTKRTPRRNFDRKTTPIKSLPLASADPPRRSSRLQNAPPVTYTEPKEDKSRRSRDFVLEEGAKPEVYTEEHEKMLGDTEMPWTFFVDGYRADGTRIYDPINGKTCHQCRQKTLGQRTHCCQCNLVRGQFCGDCLLMRYGEHVVEANQNPNWICPPCRGICNCSLCRIAKGWVPTGAIYKRIKNLGFKSVAHYLIMTKRAPPESEVSSDAPQSAKRALPFEGMEITNDDGSDDKAMVVYTEINPQSEFDSTTVVESASSSGDIGRPIMESKTEEIGAAGKSVRKSDESESKPRRVGRPRKRPKKENTDAAEESVRVSAESDSARAGSQIGNIDAGVELAEVIETAEAEPVSDMNSPNTSAFIVNGSNSECVQRSTSSSSKETDGLEDSENVATGDEPLSTTEKPDASDSKADILLEG